MAWEGHWHGGGGGMAVDGRRDHCVKVPSQDVARVFQQQGLERLLYHVAEASSVGMSTFIRRVDAGQERGGSSGKVEKRRRNEALFVGVGEGFGEGPELGREH